jgi:oxaloacetate decarboxylase gamma subunit
MTIAEMLGQSGVLTLLGMGVVFSFLVILIICVTLLGKIVRAVGAGQAGQGSADAFQPVIAAAPPGDGAHAGTAPAVTAAIMAAIAEYQKNESR